MQLCDFEAKARQRAPLFHHRVLWKRFRTICVHFSEPKWKLAPGNLLYSLSVFRLSQIFSANNRYGWTKRQRIWKTSVWMSLSHMKFTIKPTSFTGVKARLRQRAKITRIFLRFAFARTNLSAMKVRFAKSCRLLLFRRSHVSRRISDDLRISATLGSQLMHIIVLLGKAKEKNEAAWSNKGKMDVIWCEAHSAKKDFPRRHIMWARLTEFPSWLLLRPFVRAPRLHMPPSVSNKTGCFCNQI